MILFAHLREALGLPTDAFIPRIPWGAGTRSSNVSPLDNPPPATSDGKRKAPDDDSPTAPEPDSVFAKRSKQDGPFRPQVRPKQMPPLPRWPLPVRWRRLTSPSYLWGAFCHQRCPQRRKWRVWFLSCASARWSRSILEISFFCLPMLSESLGYPIAIICRTWLSLSIIQQSSIKSNIQIQSLRLQSVASNRCGMKRDCLERSRKKKTGVGEYQERPPRSQI